MDAYDIACPCLSPTNARVCWMLSGRAPVRVCAEPAGWLFCDRERENGSRVPVSISAVEPCTYSDVSDDGQRLVRLFQVLDLLFRQFHAESVCGHWLGVSALATMEEEVRDA